MCLAAAASTFQLCHAAIFQYVIGLETPQTQLEFLCSRESLIHSQFLENRTEGEALAGSLGFGTAVDLATRLHQACVVAHVACGCRVGI